MAKTKKSKDNKTSNTKKTKLGSIKVYESLSLKWKSIAIGIFTLISFALYFQVLPYGYVLDDKMVISDNNFTKSGLSGVERIFTSDSFEGYFGEQMDLVQGGRYRPLSIASFAVEHEFFGLNPMISHLGNIILYGLACALIFFFLRRLFKDNELNKELFTGIAFITALIYLANPIHTEAVANIKGRDEILSFLFSMMALHLSIKYIDTKKILSLLGVALCFLLGLFSKENTITFLAIIPFCILLFRKNQPKAFFSILGLLLSCTILYLSVRYQIIGYLLNDTPSSDIMNNPFVEMTGDQRYATVMYTMFKYLLLSVFPYPLTHDYYPYHIPIMNWSDGIVIISAALHLILVGLVFYFWKKNPIVSFSIGFYLAALSIVSNLVVNVGTFMNERFAFTASLGICLLMVFLITKGLKTSNKNIALGILAAIFIGYSSLTILRVPVWESELTLNSAAIKVSKNSARANSFMGTAIFNQYKKESDRNMRKQMLDEAKVYVDRALSMMPLYANANLMKVGIAAENHKMDGDLDKLLNSFREVIIINPQIGFITEYLKYINTREDAQKLLNFYLDVGYNELIVGQKKYKWGIHFLNLGYHIDYSDEKINLALENAYKVLGHDEKKVIYPK